MNLLHMKEKVIQNVSRVGEVKREMFNPSLNAQTNGLSYFPIQLKAILLPLYLMDLFQPRFP